MDDIDIATDNVVNTGLAYLDATGGRAAAGEITPLYEAHITALRRLRDVCANAPDPVEKTLAKIESNGAREVWRWDEAQS